MDRDRTNNTYKRVDVWGGDRQNSKDYWRRFNNIFKYGHEECELGRDFLDVSEYINDNYENSYEC